MQNPAPEENWRCCFEQLAPKLLLFARQWVASAEDAEDVVQSAFVRFWRKQPDARPEHYPLLYTAVRTAALDLLRRDQRRAKREAVSGIEPLCSPEPLFATTAGQYENAEAIATVLERLPQAQREVLVLRIWGELTFAEIAATVGESINTVASRYRYALEALRKAMKPHEYERV